MQRDLLREERQRVEGWTEFGPSESPRHLSVSLLSSYPHSKQHRSRSDQRSSSYSTLTAGSQTLTQCCSQSLGRHDIRHGAFRSESGGCFWLVLAGACLLSSRQLAWITTSQVWLVDDDFASVLVSYWQRVYKGEVLSPTDRVWKLAHVGSPGRDGGLAWLP